MSILLQHKESSVLLQLNSDYEAENNVVFVENWLVCDSCDELNPSHEPACAKCGSSMDGMPDARIEDIWAVVGQKYTGDVDSLVGHDDFALINTTLDLVRRNAPVAGVESKPVGDNSWIVRVYYDASQYWGDGRWHGNTWKFSVEPSGRVLDDLGCEVSEWPRNEIAGALNYLFGVQLPVLQVASV